MCCCPQCLQMVTIYCPILLITLAHILVDIQDIHKRTFNKIILLKVVLLNFQNGTMIQV